MKERVKLMSLTNQRCLLFSKSPQSLNSFPQLSSALNMPQVHPELSLSSPHRLILPRPFSLLEESHVQALPHPWSPGDQHPESSLPNSDSLTVFADPLSRSLEQVSSITHALPTTLPHRCPLWWLQHAQAEVPFLPTPFSCSPRAGRLKCSSLPCSSSRSQVVPSKIPVPSHYQ